MRNRVVAVVTGLVLASTALAVAPAEAATPPKAPGSVKSVPGNAKYTVSWGTPSSNGGSAIKYFQVANRYYSPSAKKFTAWVKTNVGASTRSKSFAGKNGITYESMVLAVNAKGAGAWSSRVQVEPGLPLAPTSVTAAAQNGALSVRWTAAVNNGSALASNLVYYRKSGAATYSRLTVPGSAVQKTITGLTNGSTYQVYVRGVNKYGGSANSAVATGKPSLPSFSIVESYYRSGDTIKANFSAFPSDAINVAVCRGDIAPQDQQGPPDCADFPGTASTLPTSKDGAGTTNIVLPASINVRDVNVGGSSDGTTLNCKVAGNCVLIAATYSGPFEVKILPLTYATPDLTITDTYYRSGDTITANFSGFPSNDMNVAVCRGDIAPQDQQGPPDCADFPGPSNTLPAAVKGKGTSQVVLPASINVRDVNVGGSSDGTTLNCKVAGNCVLIAATYSSPFAVKILPLTYATPTVSIAQAQYFSGDTITADFSGFPSNDMNVAVCRGDIAPQDQQGPPDCADFPGPSNTLPVAVKGKGTSQVVLPASINVRDVNVGGSSDGTTLDCSVPGNCVLIAATYSSPFAVSIIPLTYTLA